MTEQTIPLTGRLLVVGNEMHLRPGDRVVVVAGVIVALHTGKLAALPAPEAAAPKATDATRAPAPAPAAPEAAKPKPKAKQKRDRKGSPPPKHITPEIAAMRARVLAVLERHSGAEIAAGMMRQEVNASVPEAWTLRQAYLSLIAEGRMVQSGGTGRLVTYRLGSPPDSTPAKIAAE